MNDFSSILSGAGRGPEVRPGRSETRFTRQESRAERTEGGIRSAQSEPHNRRAGDRVDGGRVIDAEFVELPPETPSKAPAEAPEFRPANEALRKAHEAYRRTDNRHPAPGALIDTPG